MGPENSDHVSIDIEVNEHEDDNTHTSNDESENESDIEESDDEEPQETLAITRERRGNAGNRMAQLLQLATAEDAVVAAAEPEEEESFASIFKETADDVDFVGPDADDADAYMSSSGSEDEEQQGDDSADKEVHPEKPKKRKVETLLQKTMRLKKVKYAPEMQAASSPSVSEPTPSQKKADRIYQVQDPSKVRSSTRKLAVANKQAIHQRLKESEKRRQKTLRMMEAADNRRKERLAQVLTQEERLVQAAIIEKQNSRSLNRWEEAEKRRAEEQKARLEALQNRQLEGPVISSWSGPSAWVNDKLTYVGKGPLIEEIELAVRSGEIPVVPIEIVAPLAVESADIEPVKNDTQIPILPPVAVPPIQIVQEPQSSGFVNIAPAPPQTSDSQTGSPMEIDNTEANTTENNPAEPSSITGAKLETLNVDTDTVIDTGTEVDKDAMEVDNGPTTRQLATRSLITLSSFPNLARGYKPPTPPPESSGATSLSTRRAIDREHTSVLRTLFSIPPASTTHPADPLVDGNLIPFIAYDPSVPASGGPRHSTRYLSKRATMCPVTGMVARYRDPESGLPYANSGAFRMLRAVTSGYAGVWSGLIQAWIGVERTASGVPKEVWDGTVKLKPPVVVDGKETKNTTTTKNISNSESKT